MNEDDNNTVADVDGADIDASKDVVWMLIMKLVWMLY